jgi:large subunit ribosomal protein L2
MAVKVYKPINPGLRRTSVVKDPTLTKKRPEKSLRTFRKQRAGRNSLGQLTVRHKGGGARRFIRTIDFKRDKFDIPAKVASVEYDPNRNARIALLVYRDGEKRYIIAPTGLKQGVVLMSSKKLIDVQVGNQMPLKHIPTGTEVHNVEMVSGKGGQMCRSAGNYATLMSIDSKRALLKLPSGEIRMVSEDCMATIGTTSNAEFQNIRWGKAGRMRHRGIRPTVRGKVMNPVDHPHGGGEARNPIGMKHPKTYKGKTAMGVKTRKLRKQSDALIVKRRKGRKGR